MARKKAPRKKQLPEPSGPSLEPQLSAPLPYWSIPQRAVDTPLVRWFKQQRVLTTFPRPALHALIVIAAKRLEALNPQAARQFRDDVADLSANLLELAGLASFADLAGPVNAVGAPNAAKTKEEFDQFLDEFFEEIEHVGVAKDRRYEIKVTDAVRRWVTTHYRHMVEAIQTAQAAFQQCGSYEERCATMRPMLRAMLDGIGPAGARIELSDALTKAAVEMSPHQAALTFATAIFDDYPVASILKTRTLGAESKVRYRYIDSAVRPPRT